MIRASVNRLYDFDQFDPMVPKCWHRLRLVIRELESQQHREIAKIRHFHYSTMASNSNLSEEAFDSMQTHAAEAMSEILKDTFPWMADELGEIGIQNSREQLVKAYEDLVGKPGDPAYEEMVSQIGKVMKKGRLTRREKEEYRKKYRAKIEAKRNAQEELMNDRHEH